MENLLTTFFDITGIVHFEFIPYGQIDNQDYYVEIFKQLHEAVYRKKPELQPRNLILHCDVVPAHRHSLSSSFWHRNQFLKWNTHPVPSFGSSDFWLFPKLKSALKGQRFQDIEDIQKNVMMALKAILQQEFQKCFQQWQHHWAKCIAAQVAYLEGDLSQ
jgi:hypothetical protein